MSEILLVRHGQASFGSDNYDALSELGMRQSVRLGNYLVGAGYRFDGIYCGTLQRQLQTAMAVIQCYVEAGLQTVPLLQDPGFDEMDSEGQIRHLAPRLAQSDPGVAKLLHSAQGDKKAFQKLLKTVFSHWLVGPADDSRLQSWPRFKAGVACAVDNVRRAQGSGTTSIVFTSGGVIATVVADVLAVADSSVYTFYEPVINCSITRLLYSSERISLSSYNEFSYLQLSGDEAPVADIISYR